MVEAAVVEAAVVEVSVVEAVVVEAAVVEAVVGEAAVVEVVEGEVPAVVGALQILEEEALQILVDLEYTKVNHSQFRSSYLPYIS